jgi:hypothetical protein
LIFLVLLILNTKKKNSAFAVTKFPACFGWPFSCALALLPRGTGKEG